MPLTKSIIHYLNKFMTKHPRTITVSGETFNHDVIKRSHHTPVLVDFMADWCPPCHAISPVLKSMHDNYDGKFVLATVDTDEEQRLAGQCKIRGLPTVSLYINGQVVVQFSGAKPENEIRAIIGPHLVTNKS